MPSRAFEQIVGRIAGVERRRVDFSERKKRRGLFIGLFSAVAVISCLFIMVLIYLAYVGGYLWLGSAALLAMAVGGAYQLLLGPSGLAGASYADEKAIREIYTEIRHLLKDMDPDEFILIYGLEEPGDGPLRTIGPPEILGLDHLFYRQITPDLRVPLGEYAHLGIAYLKAGQKPDISPEDMDQQEWMKRARAAGKKESEIKAFVHSLRVPAPTTE